MIVHDFLLNCGHVRRIIGKVNADEIGLRISPSEVLLFCPECGEARVIVKNEKHNMEVK